MLQIHLADRAASSHICLGRTGDVRIVSGMSVSPSEIEDGLFADSSVDPALPPKIFFVHTVATTAGRKRAARRTMEAGNDRSHQRADRRSHTVNAGATT
jgi:hypothetical protein